MEPNLDQERRQAHAYLDYLPAAQISAVRGLLEAMLDPVSRALANAPLDDEPFTEEDRRAVAEADEWSKHNTPIPLEDVLADVGLTMADWESMAKTPLPPDSDESPNGRRNG